MTTKIKIQNYIDGQLVDPQSGQWLDNFEPATGTAYSQVPDSGTADVDAAVAAAKKAFRGWSKTSADRRSIIMNRIADLIERDLDQLIETESIDNGKPEWLARAVDIPRAAKNLRHFASTVTSSASESHAMPDAINFTLRQPIGVVGIISPWNLPLYLLTWKIAPALATGNCVVAKPSEVTPMTAFRFSELCIDAGLPPGVLNIVHGNGANSGNAIVEHADVKAVSFTGGTKTGKHIAGVVGPKLKKLSLELGGKNPNIIFADCNYEKMMETTLRSSFANQGQICLCGSRVYVEKPLYEKFKADFVQRAKKLVVGDPKVQKSNLGAVVSKPHFEKILSRIELAREEGGNVLCGGGAATVNGRCENGWFVEPTIIEGLPSDCTTNQEEIFGPVVTIQPFESDDEAVTLANGTNYGLSASVWTENMTRGNRMADQINAGVVWVNCWMVRDLRTPFGGVNQSGVGREGGLESIRFFTQAKNVCIKY